MTTELIAGKAVETAPRWRLFGRHLVEMVLAMSVGMALLGSLWAAVVAALGIEAVAGRPEIGALVAATTMTIGMGVWMRYRGHAAGRIVEMGAAMYVPYLVLVAGFWFGLVPGTDVEMGGHLLMLPAMVVAMLARRAEYSLHHAPAVEGTLLSAVGRRWPTWIALAMGLGNWEDPWVPPVWTLLMMPAAYLLIGGVRGRLRDPRLLAVQLAGLALYLVLAVAAINAEPATAVWIVAAGWGFHAVWDLAHHRADAVVPRAYAEWCGVLDLVVALTIVVFW